MKNLIVRALSGIIYVGVILGCFFAGYHWFAALVIVLACLAYEESTSISIGPIKWRNVLVPYLDILSLVAVILAFAETISPWWAVTMILVRCVAQLFVKDEHPTRRLTISFFQIFYLGTGLGTMLALSEAGKAVLAVLFFIWLNDTGAFVVGSLIGRHKLCQQISPKKTWEGFVGGLLFCVVFAVISYFYLNDWFAFLPYTNIWQWIAVALTSALFATWGDLLESMFKRNLNIKDSGKIIPGHGGILDRIGYPCRMVSVILPLCLIAVFFGQAAL